MRSSVSFLQVVVFFVVDIVLPEVISIEGICLQPDVLAREHRTPLHWELCALLYATSVWFL